LSKEFEKLTGEGEWVVLRGKEVLILPALIKDMKHTVKLIEAVAQHAESSDLDESMLNFVHWALIQAYPRLTKDQAAEVVSIRGFQRIFRAVIALNEMDELLGKAMPSMDLLMGANVPLTGSLKEALSQ